MNSYDVLRTIHKVGHPISGTVLRHELIEHPILPGCTIYMQTDSKFTAALDFQNMFDEHTPFDKSLLPPIGSKLDMVVLNHVEKTLYLSAKPSDLEPAEIQKFKDFYKLVDTLENDKQITGIVTEVAQFGIFVDLDLPFEGLIDIAYTEADGSVSLPINTMLWPKVGESIQCKISHFRFASRQIGLSWLGYLAD